jgi:hypothetical protein
MTAIRRLFPRVAIAAVALVGLFCPHGLAARQDSNAQRQEALRGLFGDYGVPTAPGLVLFPGKAEEISHISTPKDFAAHAVSFVSGWRLKSGAAFDFRPSLAVGTLTQYQQSWLRQAMFRSVISLGTSGTADTASSDVLLGFGIRIPLIDRGDPRADRGYIDSLETDYAKAANGVLRPTVQQFMQDSSALQRYLTLRREAGDSATAARRKRFIDTHWNAFRLDLGIGATILAPGGDLRPEDFRRDRLGAWLSAGVPLGSIGQGILAARTSTSQVVQAEDESSRTLVGGAVRLFLPGRSIALRAEASQTWGRHRDSIALNEDWRHFAMGAEFRIPAIGGWLNIAYGGDTSHGNKPPAALLFTYAVFKNREIKQ